MYNTFQFSSVARSCLTLWNPWTVARQASLSITNSWSLPKPISTELVIPSNHLILYCPLLLLPSIFPSIRVFSNETVLHIRWPKYWSFSFNISPYNEHPGLISFRMDWLDHLAFQGTRKRLLQHHSWKASILWCSAYFIIQLSHPYMTTGKNIALTRQTIVGNVMSLLFNMLSRLVITFFIIFLICSEFCHTLKWNSHGFTCVPHPDPPSHLPLHQLPLGLPSAPGPSACLMHPTWAGDLFHPR